MKPIKPNDLLSDLLWQKPYLLPLINSFGIRLGIQDSTIEFVCRLKSIDQSLFISVLNIYSNEEVGKGIILNEKTCESLLEVLKKSHLYYLHFLIPSIDNDLKMLLANGSENENTLRVIKNLYEKYKESLISHLQEEEQKVFPYVSILLSSIQKNEKLPQSYFSIHSFEHVHAEIDEKLYDLRNIIIRYLEPSYNDNLCNKFLLSVFMMDKEIKSHIMVEDHLFFPSIIHLEKNIIQTE